MNLWKNKVPQKKFLKLILSATIIVNLAAMSLGGVSLYESYQDNIAHTKNNAQNLSIILEKNVESMLNRINLVLSDVSNATIQHVENQTEPQQLFSFLENQRQYLADVDNMAILNNEGQSIYQFNLPFYNQIMESSQLFERTKNNADDLYISEPLKFGPAISWHIIIAKKIKRDNQFYGIVFTVLPIDYLKRLFSSIDIGHHGSIILRNQSLSIVSRIPDNPNQSYTGNKTPSKIFREAVENNTKSLVYTIASPVDHYERIYSFQKVGKYPLYITVGLSPEDSLATWKQEVFKTAGLLSFFFIMSFMACMFIINSWKKLENNEDKLQLILNSAGEAIYGVDMNGLCTFCNKACIDILGYSHENELLGKNIHDLIHHTYEDGSIYPVADCKINYAISQGHSITQDEDLFWKKNNIPFPVEYQSYPQIVKGEIVGAVVTFTDITEKKKTDNIIWQQANYDKLTELPNRYQFHHKLEEEIRNAKKHNQNFALFFIDLDHFKDVNDSLGHHTGDILLQEVAKRLSLCMKKNDTVARLGGDEFTIILSNINEPQSIDFVAQKIINVLETPFILNNNNVNISASIGITVYPKDSDNVESLLKNADQAMYVAKEDGRNRYHYFSSEMEQKLKKRLEMYNDLREAIHKKQFEFHLQPVVDLKTKQITKAETLLRWYHPEKGYISPAEFIPIAEKMGLIQDIGEWIFKESTTWLAKWLEKTDYKYPLQLSVNMSPLQLENPDIVEQWEHHLHSINLPPDFVVIEITEGLLLENNPSNTDKLNALRELGISISIDDFGTGYSAMSYLYKYNIDYIKIDRSFVHNISQEPKNKTIIEALILMAQRLDIQVIAEGIETQEQQDILLQAHCDYGQGYFLCKPIPYKDFEQLKNFSKRPFCIK